MSLVANCTGDNADATDDEADDDMDDRDDDDNDNEDIDDDNEDDDDDDDRVKRAVAADEAATGEIGEYIRLVCSSKSSRIDSAVRLTIGATDVG